MPRVANRLRIIGGEWRGRKLSFPPVPGVRPSTDRVRETLFNWLQGRLPGAHCLDLFAGSGALGLEALSRGAARAVFVDKDRRVIDALQGHLCTLGAVERGVCVRADALGFLRRRATERFDIVFLDPPFRRGLIGSCCREIAAHGWLSAGGTVYIEAEAENEPELPPDWRLVRSKRAGQVGYHLVEAPESFQPEAGPV